MRIGSMLEILGTLVGKRSCPLFVVHEFKYFKFFWVVVYCYQKCSNFLEYLRILYDWLSVVQFKHVCG